MALTHTPAPELGMKCPDFDLLGMDNKRHSLSDFSDKKALVVMFICNHCPYVKAIESRLITLARKIQNLGGEVVGICSNDPSDYPEDSFENLQKNWKEKEYGFPYLFDETQETAKKFGAVCTPDFFVFDSEQKLQYRARLDDSWKEESQVTREELFEATKSIIEGQPIHFEPTASMGCSIKWTQK